MRSSVARRWLLFITGRSLGLGASFASIFLVLLLALLYPCSNSLAETIRVVSWNLQPKVSSAPTTDTPAAPISDTAAFIETAAETLKTLQPDVVLLQGMGDAQMCSDLAQA